MSIESDPERYKSKIEKFKKRNVYLENKTEDLARLCRNLEQSVKELRKDREFTDYLLSILREGLLVLDTDLRVQFANSVFCEIFRVKTGETEGKLLYELANHPDLQNLLEKILPEKKVVEDFKIENRFEHTGSRILTLNARQTDDSQLILLAIEDVTEQRQAAGEVREAKEALDEQVQRETRKVRELTKRLAGSEQKERNRISAILHDDLQQILIAIRMNMDLVQKNIESADSRDGLPEKISEIKEMTGKAIQTTRQLTGDLNPVILKSEHLSEILNWITDRFDDMYGLKTHLEICCDFQIRDQNVRVLLLQIVRECLFNIVKHADTKEAALDITCSDADEMIIRITDKGKGFDPATVTNKESYGLMNIHERLNLFGGELEIDSAPGKGCKLIIRLPVEEELISVGAEVRR